MNIDWPAEIRRPVTLALAALALIGWVIAMSEIASYSSLRARTSSQIDQLVSAREQLTTQLDQQQKASGTLSDLQAKTAEAMAAAGKAVQDRDAAAAQLLQTTKANEASQSALTDAGAQLTAATDHLTQLRAAGAETDSKLTQDKEAAAKLEADVAARTQELADIGKRIDAVHAEEATTRQSLVQLTQEAANRSADIAKAEAGVVQIWVTGEAGLALAGRMMAP